MNPTTSQTSEKISCIFNWFSKSIDSLNTFGEYDQLQLILCAHELGVEHTNITRKVNEIATRSEADSMDYVFQFLEQLVLMKYTTGESRQERYFDYWIRQENCMPQSELTTAYHLGYLLMEENKLSTPELKQMAIDWLKERPLLPSMSFTAWVAFYLENHKESAAAKERFDELLGLRLDNGSWNNIPLQTVQIAYPLTLSNIDNDALELTDRFILNLPWESFSGDIKYETALLKWLRLKEML